MHIDSSSTGLHVCYFGFEEGIKYMRELNSKRVCCCCLKSEKKKKITLETYMQLKSKLYDSSPPPVTKLSGAALSGE